MLDLRVLGSFQVLLDGREVAGLAAQPGRAALLVFLALERSTTRDKVVGLLWPDHDTAKARHALSQALHRLRGVLGDDWLETDGERLSVTAKVESDARSFETLLEAGEHERALQLYRGSMLSGWFLGDSAAFELWVDQRRAHLERLHRRARREWIRRCRESGDLAGALRAAHEWVDVEPREDEAQHRVIELLAESGRRAAALRQFEVYTRLLAEADLSPLDETLELVARLRQDTDFSPVGAPATTTPAGNGVQDAGGSPPAAPESAATPPVPEPATVPSAPGSVATPRTPEATGVPPVPEGAAALPSAVQKTPGVRRGRRFFPWSRRTGLIATAMLLAAVFLTAGELLDWQFSPAARARLAALPPGGRVLLADFGNDTRDSLVAGVVTEALRIDLKRYLRSSLVDPAEVSAVLARMQRGADTELSGETAREVAQRAGIPAFIDGKVGAVGPGYVLSAWVVATGTGRILDAVLASARDSTELIRAIEQLSSDLRDRIRPSLEDVPQPEQLARLTTTSLEALRKYTLASRIWRDQGDMARVVHLLEEATALDSTFAMAHRARAMALMNMGASRQRRVEALTEAYRYRDRLSDAERYLTIASYHQAATGQLDEAVRAYQNLLEVDSASVTGLNNLAVIYRDMRDYAQAEPLLRRCVAVDRQAITCAVNLASVVHALGRLAEARDLAQQVARQFPENPMAHALPAWMAAAAQDYRTADSLFTAVMEMRPANSTGVTFDLALVDIARGHIADSRRYLDEVYRGAVRNAPAVAIEARLQLAWLDALIRRDTARALADIDQALNDPLYQGIDPTERPYLELADLFLTIGQSARADAALEAFLSEVPAEVRRAYDRRLYAVRGFMAMQRGRLDEAAEAFRTADLAAGSPFLVLQYLGPYEELAGRPDSAIAAYEQYLANNSTHRLMFDAGLLPNVLERLAVLHEARGDLAEAGRYYARLAELWSDADPELQPRVSDARSRAEALLGRGAASTSPANPTRPTPRLARRD